MKQSELGATPYAGFDFTNYVSLDDGTMVGFVFGHTARYRAAEDFGYNLYRLNPDGTAVFLNAGCRRGRLRAVCTGRKSALDGEWRNVFRIYLSIKAPDIRCSYFLHIFRKTAWTWSTLQVIELIPEKNIQEENYVYREHQRSR